MSLKEKASPAKKPPFPIKKAKYNTDRARLHLLGVCLLDSVYAWHIPSTIHLSEYGAMTIMLIQRGAGLEAITGHLEAVGMTEPHQLLFSALRSIPDGVNHGYIFWQSVQVLTEGVVT